MEEGQDVIIKKEGEFYGREGWVLLKQDNGVFFVGMYPRPAQTVLIIYEADLEEKDDGDETESISLQ